MCTDCRWSSRRRGAQSTSLTKDLHRGGGVIVSGNYTGTSQYMEGHGSHLLAKVCLDQGVLPKLLVHDRCTSAWKQFYETITKSEPTWEMRELVDQGHAAESLLRAIRKVCFMFSQLGTTVKRVGNTCKGCIFVPYQQPKNQLEGTDGCEC